MICCQCIPCQTARSDRAETSVTSARSAQSPCGRLVSVGSSLPLGIGHVPHGPRHDSTHAREVGGGAGAGLRCEGCWLASGARACAVTTQSHCRHGADHVVVVLIDEH